MKEKLKEFWSPMMEETNKWHYIVNIIGALGFIPAEFLSRRICGGGFWIFMLLLIIWWALVVLIFLTYRYLKSK